jgi:flagellar hook assembly protein FlgD
VSIEGRLTTGGAFRASLVHVVKASGAGLAANVAPNPLNPETTVSFQTRAPGRIDVKIYDVSGRLVKTLLSESREAGYHDLRWNGTNQAGAKVASGVYFFRLTTPEGGAVKAVTVLK